MKFEMWSFGHILLMISPIATVVALYFLLRNRSYKTRYVVGVVIGSLSLIFLIVRNVDIYLSVGGFDPEIVPLQVCHFGNIMVFFSLVFRSKTATAVAWSLNLLAAFSSLVFADSLVNYQTIWCVRAQMYIFGHVFIVLGALYAVLLKVVRIDFKSFLYGIGVVFLIMIPAIICNSYFNDVLGYGINYFFIYDASDFPLDFLYIGERAHYGWFTINWTYTVLMILIFGALMYGVYNIQKLLYLKDKDYNTYHVFSKQKAR